MDHPLMVILMMFQLIMMMIILHVSYKKNL